MAEKSRIVFRNNMVPYCLSLMNERGFGKRCNKKGNLELQFGRETKNAVGVGEALLFTSDG